jgi:hypothetical protein
MTVGGSVHSVPSRRRSGLGVGQVSGSLEGAGREDPTYFEGGFRHGHDQWISHAAASWATMGLTMAALEESGVE